MEKIITFHGRQYTWSNFLYGPYVMMKLRQDFTKLHGEPSYKVDSPWNNWRAIVKEYHELQQRLKNEVQCGSYI